MLRFFTKINESLMEQLQAEFPKARLVKAFNSVGSDLMINPHFEAGKPTMFICGNDEQAKKTVATILDQFGWETADMGSSGICARHRAAMHAVVPSRISQQPVDARVQAAEEVMDVAVPPPFAAQSG